KGARLASFLFEGSAVFQDGRFRAGDRSYDFLELAAAAERALLPQELQGALAVVADNEMHQPVFPNGCGICECEVDRESGAGALPRWRMRSPTRWQNSGCARSRCPPRRTRYGEPSTGGEVRLTLLLCACLLAMTAAAQSYPRGPVRMIVPFPAGGGVDAAGRVFAH